MRRTTRKMATEAKINNKNNQNTVDIETKNEFCSCSYCAQCECEKDAKNPAKNSKNKDEENARKCDIIDLLHNRLKVSWIIEISFNLIATIKRILFFPVLFIRYMILLFPMPTLVWLSVPLIYIISVNYQSSFVDIQQLVIFLTNKISSIYFYDDLSHHLAKSKGIKCDYNLEIYFVRVRRSQVFEIEVSWRQVNKSVEIKRCSLVENPSNYESAIQVIEFDKSSLFLDYYCSKLNEKTSATLTSPKTDIISEMIDYLNDDRDDLDQSEMECLNEFKSCTPTVRRKSKKFNLNNQLDFDLKHCFCVKNFYNCLQSLPFKSQIGMFYFDYLKLKCFNYEFKNSCKIYFLGNCILYGEFECRINLVKNSIF